MNQFAEPYSDRIPSAVVAPVLERVIRDYGKIVSQLGNPGLEGSSGSGNHGVAELVASQFGGKTDKWFRSLRRILTGESKETSISTVDHFLVALGAHHLWYVPPLSDYYFSQAILDMPEEDCGDLMHFACCNRWGTVAQKVPGPSRQCRSCRKKYNQSKSAHWKEAA